MEKIIQLLENTLHQNGYSFTVGHTDKDNEYQYFFWNNSSPIVYGCSFNPDKTDEYANVGALEIGKMSEEPRFACYIGWLKENLTEDSFHFCIEEVTRMLKYELESEVYDEDMRSVLRLGNHTTDIEAYFIRYGYQRIRWILL